MSCNDDTAKGCGNYCRAGSWRQFFATIVQDTQGNGNRPWYFPTQTEPLISRDARAESGNGRRCSWFWITVHVHSFYRSVSEAAVFTSMRTDELAEIPTQGSSLQAKLTLGDNTRTQRTLYVDFGAGFSFCWYGTSVQVEALIEPTPGAGGRQSVVVNPGEQVQLLGTLVEDSIIEANAVIIDSSHDYLGTPLTLTEVFKPLVPGDTFVAFRPPGARRVSVMSSNGTTGAQFLQGGFGPPNLSEILSGPWVGGNIQTVIGSTPVDIPGPASKILFTADDTDPYYVIWEVLP